MTRRFSGDQFAVEVQPRRDCGNPRCRTNGKCMNGLTLHTCPYSHAIAPLIAVFSLDDGNWFEAFSFDESFLPELIDLLADVQNRIPEDPDPEPAPELDERHFDTAVFKIGGEIVTREEWCAAARNRD